MGTASLHERRSGDKRSLSRKRREKDTWEVAKGVRGMIAAVGRRVAREDPDDLRHLVEIEAVLAAAWDTAVAGLRQSGFSDGDIGLVLGHTKQAVAQRFPRRSRDA